MFLKSRPSPYLCEYKISQLHCLCAPHILMGFRVYFVLVSLMACICRSDMELTAIWKEVSVSVVLVVFASSACVYIVRLSCGENMHR